MFVRGGKGKNNEDRDAAMKMCNRRKYALVTTRVREVMGVLTRGRRATRRRVWSGPPCAPEGWGWGVTRACNNPFRGEWISSNIRFKRYHRNIYIVELIDCKE